MLEMKEYSEIDLDESPIVVLSCGHFFTAETLDGITGIAEVYEQNALGEFVGLRDISTILARPMPVVLIVIDRFDSTVHGASTELSTEPSWTKCQNASSSLVRRSSSA
jgi:hypothetical protein